MGSAAFCMAGSNLGISSRHMPLKCYAALGLGRMCCAAPAWLQHGDAAPSGSLSEPWCLMAAVACNGARPEVLHYPGPKGVRTLPSSLTET